MILESIHIENFKGIESYTIQLKKGFNLLIGDNGVGKTSILEAISVGLGGFIAGLEDIATKHFTQDEIRVALENTGEGSYNKRYMTPIQVECKAVIEEQEYQWTRRKNSLKASRSTVEPREICKKAFQMANEENHILPILSYQSTARMWMQKRETSENIFAGNFYRTVGYTSCLSEASNNKMLMNWIRKMEMLEWKKKETIAEYQAVKNIIKKFMNIMSEEEVLGVEFDGQSEEIVYLTEKQMLPIGNLSSGYQSLIWMVFDIAFRMALLNPDLCEKISETPGIILIDELDMHLHPKWQWNVVEALKTTFPNIQFIAATHSPMIIASCKGENLITIQEKNLEEPLYMETPYGLEVNDILEYYQGSSALSKEIASKMQKFMQEIENGNLQQAEQIFEQLKEEMGENHPQVVKAEMELSLEKIPLEE